MKFSSSNFHKKYSLISVDSNSHEWYNDIEQVDVAVEHMSKTCFIIKYNFTYKQRKEEKNDKRGIVKSINCLYV